LAKGGISLTEAKTVALSMKKTREELRELIAIKTNLDTHTAEGQADNARFVLNSIINSLKLCVFFMGKLLFSEI
jgi:hypothetical protein